MTGDNLLPDALEFTLGLVADVGKHLAGIFLGRTPLRREWKQDGSLLTDADLEANERILGGIRGRFSDHGILTEEGGTTAPAEALSWIVDPLDGTTNYAAGRRQDQPRTRISSRSQEQPPTISSRSAETPLGEYRSTTADAGPPRC